MNKLIFLEMAPLLFCLHTQQFKLLVMLFNTVSSQTSILISLIYNYVWGKGYTPFIIDPKYEKSDGMIYYYIEIRDSGDVVSLVNSR